jgi:hypothetical protein
LSQECQRPLAEIKPTTLPTKAPQLNNALVQAVSKDLKKKLIQHIAVLPANTIDKSLQRFNNMVQFAVDAEDELKTATDVTHGAAFQTTRPCGGKGNATPPRSQARTFMAPAAPTAGVEEQESPSETETEKTERHQQSRATEEHNRNLEENCNRNLTRSTTEDCTTVKHPAGKVLLPTCCTCP